MRANAPVQALGAQDGQFDLSGKRAASLPPPPLRTGRAAFTASGSSASRTTVLMVCMPNGMGLVMAEQVSEAKISVTIITAESTRTDMVAFQFFPIEKCFATHVAAVPLVAGELLKTRE